MRTKRIDDAMIAKLPTPASGKKATALGDGLYVVTYASGLKSFGRIERNAAGNNQLKPFAPFADPNGDSVPGAFTYEQARVWMHEHAVAKHRSQATAHADQTRARIELTFDELVEQWHRKKIAPRNDMNDERKRRHLRTVTAHFLNVCMPESNKRWGDVRLAEFNAPGMVDNYEATLYATERRQAKAGERGKSKSTLGHELDGFMQQVFDYAIAQGLLAPQFRPTRNKKVRKPKSVTRYMTIAELERMFEVTSEQAVYGNDAITEFDACFFQVCTFAGIRINSVRLARRSTMHRHAKDFWTFPAEELKKTKTQDAVPTDHHIPITSALAQLIARLDRACELTGVDPFFPERRYLIKDNWREQRAASARSVQKPASQVVPFSASWARKRVNKHAALLAVEGAAPVDYRGHAFRRTQSNWMRELGIPNHIIDLCQARVARETAKTYLTAEARDQVFNAFMIYHAFLEACMQQRGQAFIDAVRARRRADTNAEIAAIRKAAKIRPLAAVS